MGRNVAETEAVKYSNTGRDRVIRGNSSPFTWNRFAAEMAAKPQKISSGSVVLALALKGS